jgi:hypothetical protein
MKASDFYAAIRSHPKLFWGDGPRDDRVYIVYCPGDGVQIGWELESVSILTEAWWLLEQVLTGKLRAAVMAHWTRIVGYYSNMRNWNRSKLAEARDRSRGDYAVREAA